MKKAEEGGGGRGKRERLPAGHQQPSSATAEEPFHSECSLPPPPLPFSLFKVTLANVIFHESFSIYQGPWLAKAARECLAPLDFI